MPPVAGLNPAALHALRARPAGAARGDDPTRADRAALVFTLVFNAYNLGGLLGYLFSAFGMGVYDGFRAAPLMNSASYAFVVLTLGYLAAGPLRYHVWVPRRVGYFGFHYLGMAVCSYIGLLIGIQRAWPVVGVVADFLYMFSGAVIYLFMRGALRADSIRGGDDESEKAILGTFLKGAVAWGFVMLLFFVTRIPGGFGCTYPMAQIAALGYMAAYRRQPLGMAVLAASLFAFLPEWNRTTLILIIVMTALYTAARASRRTLMFLVPVVPSLAAVAVACVALTPLADSKLGVRLRQISMVSTDAEHSQEIAVSQRFYEGQAVMRQLEAEDSVFTWVFGVGAGGTIDMSKSRDGSVRGAAILGDEHVHNIHIHNYAVIFRHGLFGWSYLVVYFYIITPRAAFVEVRRARRTGRAGFQLVSAIFLVEMILEATVASGHFMANPVLPLFAAYLDHKQQPASAVEGTND